MSQKQRTDPVGSVEVSESPRASLSKLAELARQAYERRDTAHCLDLTRSMLLIDPDNADAQWMRSSIQSEMHRDLENARELLRPADSKENTEQSQPGQAAGAAPQLISPAEDVSVLKLAIAASTSPATSGEKPGRRWILGASVVVIGVGAAILPIFRTRTNSVVASPPISSVPDKPKQIVNDVVPPAPTPQPQPAAPVPVTPIPGTVNKTAAAAPITKPRVPVPVPRPSSDLSERPAVLGRGMLAISSLTSVDIYEDGVYLGSVPVSLELSSGTHTLEYRHGALRKNVTHVVNSNETSRAMITFDVSVRINSKPWAEVFIDGAERKALGQTPLSDVRVPIGSVLIFENPQFPTRKYRVTGAETGIQNVFP